MEWTMSDRQAADLLADAAKALHGPDEFLAPFSRDIGVNPRSVRNWLNGKRQPDPDVLLRARDLLLARRDALDHAARNIDAHLAKGA
jgi:hypothetical protein